MIKRYFLFIRFQYATMLSRSIPYIFGMPKTLYLKALVRAGNRKAKKIAITFCDNNLFIPPETQLLSWGLTICAKRMKWNYKKFEGIITQRMRHYTILNVLAFGPAVLYTHLLCKYEM